MELEDQILALSNDLNQLTESKSNFTESNFKNLNNIINSYHYIKHHVKDNYICSLTSLIYFVNYIVSSDDKYFDIHKAKDAIDIYTNLYLSNIIYDKYYYSELNLIFINAQNIIQKNLDDNKTSSCNFNPLRFFNIDETLHSRLITKLLNPNDEHGQGKLFLMEFLKLLEIDNPDYGEWIITAETSRIDILLKRVYPACVIIIENKSNGAIDQQNQLYRYWFQEIYLKTRRADSDFYIQNKNKYKIIYLPSNYSKYPDIQSCYKPQNEHWTNFKELPDIMPVEYELKTFNDFVVKWLNNCLSILLLKNNHRMIEYLKQYIEICNNL